MKKQIAIFSIFLLIFTSCSPANYNKVVRESEVKFYSGHPMEAARFFLPRINSKGKDQLLFLMEAGTMLHTAGNYKKSIEVFEKASKIASVSTTSVSKQVASLVSNEGNSNYNGEDFERVLIHMYQGLNYLMIKDPDNARVEFKRVNEELQRIKQETGRYYKQNIMAKYLTALSYEMIGDADQDPEDWEFAYIEYKQVYKLYPQFSLVRADLQRLSKKLKYMDDYKKWRSMFGVRDSVPKDSGEVVVIFQAGRGAIKVSRGKLMSDRSMARVIRVSIRNMPPKAGVTVAAISAALHKAENPIPKFVKRSNKIKRLDLIVNNRRLASTIPLEIIDSTAVKNLQDDYGRLYKKVAIGVVTKVAVSLAAGYAAKKIAESSDSAKGVEGLVGLLVGAGAGALMMSQIGPDLRCWHSLPANLQIARMFLRPGQYTMTLNFIGQNGSVVKKETENFTVEKGKRTFLNYRTLY